MITPPADPVDAVNRVLDRLSRRRHWASTLAALCGGTALTTLWALVAALIDRRAAFPVAVRWVAFAGVVVGIVATVFGVVRAALRFDTRQAAARRLESADPGWAEGLVTVVSQATLAPERRGSSAMNTALAEAVVSRLTARPPAAYWPRRTPATLAAVAVLWAGLWPVPGLDLGQSVDRQVRPWATLAPVTATRIDVHPLKRPVVADEPLNVAATISGLATDAMLWFGPDAAHLLPVPMTGTPATATLPLVPDTLAYRVTAGDAATDPVVVTVHHRPGVDALSVRLDYPPATRRPPVTQAPSDGHLRVPAGTRVTVRFTATGVLKSACVHVGRLAADAKPVDRGWEASFLAEESTSWSIRLIALDGLHGPGPPDLSLDVIAPTTRP